jgi:hypothetical protein
MKGFRFSYVFPAVLCVAGLMANAQENPAQMNPTPVQNGAPAPVAGQEGPGAQTPLGQHAFHTANMGGKLGQVTEVGPDHVVIKTATGEVFRINVLDRTRVVDGAVHVRAAEQQTPPVGGEAAQPRPVPMGGFVPQTMKLTEIKIGDYVTTVGEIPPGQGIINASMLTRLDPERVKEMKARDAEFGKTWLMGKVTAIDGTKITLTGSVDSATHTFVVDDNTSFQIRRAPATLADVHVDGMIRVEGSVNNGVFAAKTVTVMGGGRMSGGPNGNSNGWPIQQQGQPPRPLAPGVAPGQQPNVPAAPQQSAPATSPAPQPNN